MDRLERAGHLKRRRSDDRRRCCGRTGVSAYLVTGMSSWTALIPSIVGVLLLVCGLVGRQGAARKHAMPTAAAVALLGLGAPVSQGGPSAARSLHWDLGGSCHESCRPAACV